MKLESCTRIEQLAGLRDEWNSLLPDNATNEVFLTWQWQTEWWNAYHPGDLIVLMARDDSGKLVGIAPWFIEQPARTIRTIGCVEVTDYLDMLVAPHYRDEFYAALADYVIENANLYNKIDLCNIPGGPTIEVFARLLAERGFSVDTRQQEVCPTIKLPSTFEAYVEGLDKKNRHELRRKIRRAEGNVEDKVDWYIVGPQHNLDEQADLFLDLMRASHQDKAQFLEDQRNIVFFKAMVQRMAACGWLQLSFLTVNGKAAATYLNFDYGNRILVYNSGLIPATYSHLSPGIVLLAYNIQYAIEHGRHEFDFLRGNEEYKYRMGAQDRPVFMLEAIRNN